MGRGNLIQNSLQLTPFNRSRLETEREAVDFTEEFCFLRERYDRFAYNFPD